jgi:hypothetical protein
LLFFSNIFEILKYFPIYRMNLKFEIIEFEAETWGSSSVIHTLDDRQVSAAADVRMILKVTRAKVGGLSPYAEKNDSGGRFLSSKDIVVSVGIGPIVLQSVSAKERR